MSDDDTFDLDRASDRAWRRLRRALARHLAAMDDDDTLVIDVEAGDDGEVAPYVQFAAEGDLLVFEVSSNEVLTGVHRLGPTAEAALASLGLAAPTRALTADAADGDMSGMGAHAHTPDMDMSSPDHTAAMSGPGWISAVSLTLTVVFAVAAIVWLYRLFVAEQSTALAPVHPSPGSQAGNIAVDALPASRPQSVAAACEVAMAAGMAIMMGVV